MPPFRVPQRRDVPLCGDVPRPAERGIASGQAPPDFAEERSRPASEAHLPAGPRAAAAVREGSRKLRECRLDVSCEVSWCEKVAIDITEDEQKATV